MKKLIESTAINEKMCNSSGRESSGYPESGDISNLGTIKCDASVVGTLDVAEVSEGDALRLKYSHRHAVAEPRERILHYHLDVGRKWRVTVVVCVAATTSTF